MIIHRRLSAGQPGTKRLLQQYGERLVCVRYRYDSERKEKIKTVEIIVDKNPWNKNGRKIPANKIMHLRVAYNETKMRSIVKAAGGKWNKEEKVWELSYGDVLALGLKDRIVSH